MLFEYYTSVEQGRCMHTTHALHRLIAFKYMQAFSSRDVTSNDYVANKTKYTQPHISSMLVRGNTCFDFDHYKGKNADLAGMSNGQAWEHFVLAGQFESRPFR